MNSIIERVARAIAETGNGGVWTDETWYKEHQRDFHRKRARAAIDAMKEPTKSMITGANLYATDEDAVGIYTAMISAALTDNQPA